MAQRSLFLVVLVVLATALSSVDCFSASPDTTPTSSSSSCSSRSASGLQQDRRIALSNLATTITGAAAIGVGALINTPTVASAGEVDPNVKGTKKDPGYEACVSKCLYECTKPKGDEQKSRAECIPECKQKCATTKEQLMVGTPIKN